MQVLLLFNVVLSFFDGLDDPLEHVVLVLKTSNLLIKQRRFIVLGKILSLEGLSIFFGELETLFQLLSGHI